MTPSIKLLLSLSCPFTVFRVVAFVVINAFKAKITGRSFPHVVIKVNKPLKPTVTYGNTATAVVSIRLIGRFITALNHVLPGFVFACSTHAVLGIATIVSGNVKKLALIVLATKSFCNMLFRTSLDFTQSYNSYHAYIIPRTTIRITSWHER